MKRISIDPITRLEGHGKIDIFLADDGSVANCYFQVPELRGFREIRRGNADRGGAACGFADLRRLTLRTPPGLG